MTFRYDKLAVVISRKYVILIMLVYCGLVGLSLYRTNWTTESVSTAKGTCGGNIRQ